MSEAKYNMAIGVFEDKIYIIGGSRGDTAFGATEQYDPLTDTWTTKTPMPVARHLAYFAATSDKIYLFGFGDPIYVYDMETDSWTTRAGPPFDNAFGPAAAAMSGKICVFGGKFASEGAGIPDVYEYDLSTETWSAKAPMVTGVSHLWQAASVVGNKVYVLGGQTAYPTQSTTLVQEGTLEPTCWIEQPKLLASDGATWDYFGNSVSISGDYAIVGADGDDNNGDWVGSVYIFKRDGTRWVQQQKLMASDGDPGDYFGYTVSISGDYAIVGSVGDDDNGWDSGSAYILKRDGTTWVQQQKLLASDGAPEARFGDSVSISGDWAIVGAESDDDNGWHSGSAYMFRWDGTSWVQQQKLLASDGSPVDHFGNSVSISGDYAIVGATHDDDNGDSSGSGYVFNRDGESWTQVAKLTASDGAARDQFGVSVSISGDYVIVGAIYDDDNGTESGSAYIFNRDGTSWVQQQKLLASDGAASDVFGFPVSITGDYAIVGAWGNDDNGNESGSVYIFKRDGTSWVQQQKLMASDGAPGDYFGYTVSISGDYIIVGAYSDDDNGDYSGSAYIFENICNAAPVADAGDDAEYSTGLDGTADVQLDGCGSSDPGGDELTYRWLLEGEQIASGCNPVISLPCGTYIITLIVNDGLEDSQPDDVQITVLDGTPPVITCPRDVTLECPADTSVGATGRATATDACGSVAITLTDVWTPGCGNTGILTRTWTATDECGNRSVCVQTITVVDTTPPVFRNPPADVVVECDGSGNTGELNAWLASAVAEDTCGDVTITHDFAGLSDECAATGLVSVTWRAVDECGNTSTTSATFTIVDTTAPVVNSLSANPSVLWAPNHKMEAVTVSVDAADLCDETPVCRIINVTANEPINGVGDGNTEADWEITGDLTVKLRAERSGKGTGRVYTIYVECVDACGNSTVATVNVSVSHDQRRR